MEIVARALDNAPQTKLAKLIAHVLTVGIASLVVFATITIFARRHIDDAVSISIPAT